MRQNLIIAVLVLALAACATPLSPPAADGSNAAVDGATVAPVATQQDAAAKVPQPLVLPPFPPADLAQLEPLPMPRPDLWERIADGYAIPDLVDDPLVTKWEHYYAGRPDYMARSVERSRRYLYHIVTTISARNMPLDLALLPMVESAYNPTALSTSRASGIWQFVPSTGKLFGLEQNFWFDSRRDIVAATNSALDYLQKLHDQFGDWQLALAAYNWGEGNVARAIARNQKRGLPTDYASLTMPTETRNYLPKLQALKNIVADPEKYGVALADIPDAPYFTVVKITRKMDVKRAAELAEMPLDEFALLNPQHNRPVIAGADEYTILLPIDKAELFAAKLELTDQPLVSWQAYRLKPNETMAQVSARYGMSEDTLRALNGIGARAHVPPGHALLVPAERPSEATVQALSDTVFTTVPQGRTFYYRVRRGDTLALVAKRYGVSTGDLRQWNSRASSPLRAGDQLRIVSDRGETTARHARTRRAGNAGGAAKAAATSTQVVPATAASTPSTKPAGAAASAAATKPAAKSAVKSARSTSPRSSKQASRHTAPRTKTVKTPAKPKKTAPPTTTASGGAQGG